MRLDPEQRERAFRPHGNMKGLLRRTDEGAFLAVDAVVCGDVRLAPDVNVWFACVIRADDEPITIGRGTNVQDGTVIHVDFGYPVEIGDYVTIGHKAMVHGCRIRDHALIGMGAILLNGCDIGEDAIVGAGAVVPEGMVVPPRSLVLGVPARVRGEVRPEQVERTRFGAQHYIERVQTYL